MGFKIVRKMDELGRIVVPKDIRKTLQIDSEDYVEFSVFDGCIMIRKVEKEEN